VELYQHFVLRNAVVLKTSLRVSFSRCFYTPPRPSVRLGGGGRWWCLEQDAEETVWTKEAGSCRELYNEKPYDLSCSQNVVGLMDCEEGEMDGMLHSEMHFGTALFR
jgi:hypothetical protein